MTTSSIARYLRLGETFERPVAPTEVAPGELGRTGSTVARYLKLDRHERPAKQRPVSKERPAAKQGQAKERPAAKPVPKKQRHLRLHHEAKPRRAPAVKRSAPAMVQCPDCDAMVSPTWGQCPNCALILDIAA